MLKLLNNATVFQNRKDTKKIANFGDTALHFGLSFNVEGLVALIDWYIRYKDEKFIDTVW